MSLVLTAMKALQQDYLKQFDKGKSKVAMRTCSMDQRRYLNQRWGNDSCHLVSQKEWLWTILWLSDLWKHYAVIEIYRIHTTWNCNRFFKKHEDRNAPFKDHRLKWSLSDQMVATKITEQDCAGKNDLSGHVGNRVSSLMRLMRKETWVLEQISFFDDVRYIFADLATLGTDIRQEPCKLDWKEETAGLRFKYDKARHYGNDQWEIIDYDADIVNSLDVDSNKKIATRKWPSSCL